MAAFGPIEDRTSLAHKADQLAENAFMRLAARAAMVFATFVGLPLCGYVAKQTLDKIDGIASDQASISRTVDSLGYRIGTLESAVQRDTPDYRAADATRDFRLRDQRDADQDRRIGENSAAIGKIQDRLMPGIGIPR